jgi:peptidyl-tRNA hydrolase, PTH1 family
VKVVVGLRNPGSDYEGTRHNIGAEVLAEVARRHGGRFKSKTMRTRSEMAEVRVDGEKVVLAAPCRT